MTSTPNYVSNADLASRLSALVERWATRESEMVALLTQPTGTVNLTDGVGQKHTLASYPALLSEVERMVDGLHGVTAATSGMVDLARQHATASSNAAAISGDHADRAAVSAETAADVAASALETAAVVEGHRQAAQAIASAVAQYAADADESAVRASGSAVAATASAALAGTRADTAGAQASNAAASASLAALWANAPSDTVVADGQYSAQHWANVAARLGMGTLVYMGGWDASTGTAPADPKLGHFYKVTTAGVVDGVTYNVGDQAIYNGTSWDLIDNTDLVQSVNGKVGAVVLTAADIGGLGALAVKSKVDFATDVTGLPEAFTPASHTHTKGDVGLANVDNTADVDKPVSNAVQAALANKANLTGENTFTGGQYIRDDRLFVGTNVAGDHAVRIIPSEGTTTIQGVTSDQTAFCPLSFRATAYSFHGGNVFLSGATEVNVQLNPTGGRSVRFVANNTPSTGLYDATNSAWLFRIDSNNKANFAGGIGANFVDSPTVTATTITANNAMYLPSSGGSLLIRAGTGDNANWSTYNTLVRGWWGLAFSGYDGVPSLLMDLRAGHMYGRGNATFDGIVGSSSVACGAGVVLEPNGHIWVGDANNRSNRRRQPRVFVQSADPGAAAVDGDLWIW